MNYVVKNLTRRPVSILCNSGKSYHLPPKHAYEIAGIEIENNQFVKKLADRKVLAVSSPKAGKTASPEEAAKPKKSTTAKAASTAKPKTDKADK